MHAKSVTFDSRSLMVNGRRVLLLSGAVHYWRSTPEDWPRILAESRAAGLNTIETYVFWGGHEPEEGVYDFSGRFDLGRFLDLCAAEGFHVILRIGPYICAEVNFGGLPWWLAMKPGIVTRTLNRVFMEAVDRWLGRLMCEAGPRQASQGGPVILVQLENEYANVAARYGRNGRRYLRWCVESGRAAGITEPLIMCEGAPPGVVATLNGFSVWPRVAHLRRRPRQPVLWTEAWTGWYDTWGEPHHLRRPREIAYEVLRFFAAGGTGVNHYMWHGGTNFGREGMYLQSAGYGFDAPLDEAGFPTAKSLCLARLHAALHRHRRFFLEGRRLPVEVVSRNRGSLRRDDGVFVHAFKLGAEELAVVVNGGDWPAPATVRGLALELPGRGALLLAGRDARFHTAYQSWWAPEKEPVRTYSAFGKPLAWRGYSAPPPQTEKFLPVRFPHNMLLSTHDKTDYGWYRATVHHAADGTALLSGRVADLATVWVNGQRAGTVPAMQLKEDRPREADFHFSIPVPLRAGANELLILVSATGLVKGDWMLDAPQSKERKGLLSAPMLDGRRTGPWEFAPWPVECGAPAADTPAGAALHWFETTFHAGAAELDGGHPWAFEPGGLRKGLLWVNGRLLGRYWSMPAHDALHARYTNHPHLINTGYGQPTQARHHIPAAWLKPGANTLTVLEEQGAAPDGARLLKGNPAC